MKEIWLLMETDAGEAAFNMALDEVLLASAVFLARPVLRFYGWAAPAATFGYSQNWAQVSAATELRPLIRRPTGGGLVLHDHDWTYTVVFPPGHGWAGLRARESYRQLHEWVGAALMAMGVEASLAPTPRRELPGVCFVGAEESDVLSDGMKVAGAAQRRNRQGLLIQGSVRPPDPGLRRADFEVAFRRAAEDRWVSNWERLSELDRLKSEAQELVGTRYGSAGYNQRR